MSPLCPPPLHGETVPPPFRKSERETLVGGGLWRKINIIDYLSPAEAETGTELGKKLEKDKNLQNESTLSPRVDLIIFLSQVHAAHLASGFLSQVRAARLDSGFCHISGFSDVCHNFISL